MVMVAVAVGGCGAGCGGVVKLLKNMRCDYEK